MRYLNRYTRSAAADAGTYLALAADNVRVIAAAAIGVSFGSPGLIIANSTLPVWSMPESSATAISTVADIPPHWATFKASIDCVWLAAAASGNVYLRPEHGFTADAAVLVRTLGTHVAQADGVQYARKRVQLLPTLTNEPTKAFSFGVTRRGDDGVNDTCTAAVGISAFVFERLT